jgi:Spy/CpxP family protein refolding chaperone
VGILVPDDQAEDVANIALARDRSVERHLTPEQRAQLNDLLREIPGGA